MLTPVDLQNKVFKRGIGYDKKEVEAFLSEITSDYEELYRSNVELKDKIAALDQNLQHYRSMEDSMQKALTISEKTAEETVNAANEKSNQITAEAEKQAEAIIAEAKEELAETKNEIFLMKQQYTTFKKQVERILQTQSKALDGEVVDIDLGNDFEPRYNNSYSDSPLGGLGGGYVGNNGGFEHTNQDPAFSYGTSLNMDPFEAAQNGGGRFSKQNMQQPQKRKDSKKETKATKHEKVVEKVVEQGEVEENIRKSKHIDSADNYAKDFEFTEDVSVEAFDTEKDTVSGEVEDRVKESSMLDSEDNHDEGFDFIDTSSAENSNSSESSDVSEQSDSDNVAYSGEVETRVNESSMLDSEDNHEEGFDFVDDSFEDNFENAETTTSFPDDFNFDENTYTGEVEDRVNESSMLDSEDNHEEGFDFVVGDEDGEDEIPTIFPNPFSKSSAV